MFINKAKNEHRTKKNLLELCRKKNQNRKLAGYHVLLKKFEKVLIDGSRRKLSCNSSQFQGLMLN